MVWRRAEFRSPGRHGVAGCAACALALLLAQPLSIAPASGQAMREVRELPDDCRALIPAQMRGTVQPWQRYVWLEHCDRIKRLVRLSALLPPAEQPRFFEGVVPAARLPAEFGTDVPVLRVVFPERTFFDTARTDLRDEAQPVLDIVAASLRNEPPDVALFIAGHADSRGARALNEGLSIDRAETIAQRIFRGGIAFSSIWRIGFGSDMPLVSGATAYAWDRNRRVEFLFAAKPEAVAIWLADQQLDGLCQASSSVEVAACKARLDFKDRYDAIEISRPPAVAVAPRSSDPTALGPESPKSRREVALPAQARNRVAPAGAARTALIDIDAGGARRIHIDPRARRVPPVHLDL